MQLIFLFLKITQKRDLGDRDQITRITISGRIMQGFRHRKLLFKHLRYRKSLHNDPPDVEDHDHVHL